MKILFLSEGGMTCDYQRDCLAHGLRTLLGSDFIDYPRLDTLYRGIDTTKLYGSGFTLYGLLPDIPVDRTDIPRKIRDRYFDIIVWGSIHRCQSYLHEAASVYEGSRRIAIDGEDHPGHLDGLGGISFKRELYNPQPNTWPIQFGIPAEKILPHAPAKSRMMAPCDPIDRKTYVYKSERDYYAQYASAYYAATMKKAGWDCLRHYEILSQWTLPYFRVMDQLPPTICERLPRRELLLVQRVIEAYKDSMSDRLLATLQPLYECLIEPVMTVVRRDLTTTALALRVLDTIGVTHTTHLIPKEAATCA